MDTDNALMEAAHLVSCARCAAYIRAAGGFQVPCMHLVCADCRPVNDLCRVCGVLCQQVLFCPTIGKIVDLLELRCPENKKVVYQVTLSPCTLPGIKSLSSANMTVDILGDIPVDKMAEQVQLQLHVPHALVFGMYGERLTGAEMMSELASCCEQGEITLECGVLN